MVLRLPFDLPFELEQHLVIHIEQEFIGLDALAGARVGKPVGDTDPIGCRAERISRG